MARSAQTWHELVEQLSVRYRERPGPALEQRIRVVFEQQPALVRAAGDHVTERYESGLIHAPWPILVKEVEKRAARGRLAVSGDAGASERAKAIARAEQWVRAAGIHFDRASEVEDELFGDFGNFRAYRDDEQFRAHIAEYWEQQRPRGEQVEAEMLERAKAWKAQQQPRQPRRG